MNGCSTFPPREHDFLNNPENAFASVHPPANGAKNGLVTT